MVPSGEHRLRPREAQVERGVCRCGGRARGAGRASPAPRCSSRRRRAPCSDRGSRAGRPPPGRSGRAGRRRAAARPPRPARRWGPCPAAQRPAPRSAWSTCGAPGTAASSRVRARNAPPAPPSPGRLPAAPRPSAGGQSPGRARPCHRPLTSPGRRPHLRRPTRARSGLRPQPHGLRRRPSVGRRAGGCGVGSAARGRGTRRRRGPPGLGSSEALTPHDPRPSPGAPVRGGASTSTTSLLTGRSLP